MVALVSSRHAWRTGLGWLLVLGILCSIFPPFHVRSLNTPVAESDALEAAPAAEASARRLWRQMLAARASAIELDALLEALERDPAAAERQYGRRIGYGGPAFYFVYGEGRVIEPTRKGVMLEIASHPTKVMLVTGPVFGNALRDATALADMRDFSSFEFNALSTELNLLSERRVQPRIAELSEPGTLLRFVGGATYVRRDGAATLQVVAIDVERADR
jgi:predicted lipoprotein